MAKKYLDGDGLLYYHQKVVNQFVKKDGAKVLSTNDYTTTEKNKLAGIEEGATKTTIVDGLTSTSATSALSANQGKVLNDKIAAINTNLEDLGAGDMLKSVYDVNDDGVVDNAEKLGGQLPSYYAKASDIPTNNNELTNGAGYQTASQVTTAINNAIADIQGISYEVVTELPSTGEAGVIYLISNNGSNPNIYDEYIYTNGVFEKIGTTDVDLSNYVQSTDLVAITNSEIDTIVS